MRTRALLIAIAASFLVSCGAVGSLAEPAPGDLLQKAGAITAPPTH